MQPKFRRLVIGATALAVAAGGSIVSNNPALALPAGTAPDGSVTIPATQPLTTTLAMAPNPAPAICDGITSVDGTKWHAFISDAANDPATIDYTGSGATAPIGFTSSLLSSTGTFVTNVNTSSLGQITPIPGFNLSAFGAALAPGEYNIGFACSLAGETTNYWSTLITVAATSYTAGVAPDAPVLSLGAGTGTEQTINLVADSSVDSYTVNVTPAPGAALPTVAPGDTSFGLTGLTLGTSYSVTLTANKTSFPSATSSPPVVFTAAATTPAPVVTAPDAFENTAVTVTWVAPASGPAPASYDVAITPGGPTLPGVVGLSQVIPAGLAIGSYTATVTPNYAAGSGLTGTPGSDGFSVTPNTLVLQEITVTRPPGALILTQRCGVYGPLDPFVAVDAFPGFPRDLVLETASADQIGTSPDIDLVTPGVQDDPEFGNYPEPTPPTYPTECGLSMDTARFVTSGALAGQFYTADGRLNQVTVLDTRDTDTGWIARGDIEDDFTGSTGDTFSGDYLGWTPQVTDTSDPVGGSAYDQIVTAGPQVLPGTPVGLTGNPILGESQVNEGLGIATMDARMKLLIPASANAADYSATLSLTVVPRP